MIVQIESLQTKKRKLYQFQLWFTHLWSVLGEQEALKGFVLN